MNLNPQQKQAVEFGNGPLLILAGAGSGKTRALTCRAAYLVKDKGVDPQRILLVTFTNKAAKEMKGRVKKLVPGAELPWAGTFHSFCCRILRIDGYATNLDKNFVIFDEDDSLAAIKKAMKNLQIELKPYRPRSIKAAISAAKNELIFALEYQQMARGLFSETVARVYREYQKLLAEYNALDFDDLLTQAVKLLQQSRETAAKYQEKFLYVLVDEYQDTNKAQYELTKLLTKKHRNLTAVGDFSQSIYSFRGADFRNLNNLRTDFPDLTIINLEQNYRSTQNILNAANQVIVKNRLHPILRLWTNDQAGPKLKLFEAVDEKEEAAFIANQVKQENYRDCAVLYRTNAQSRTIEEEFLKQSIPYLLVGGVRFYQRKEIKDCLAYLKLLVNPKDKVSRERLEKLGKTSLNKFLTFQSAAKTTKKILKQVLKATNYLDRFDPKDEEDLMRLENIKELTSVAQEYPHLNDFLQVTALAEDTDALKDNPNSVTLMTLHASKGLEFKTVFMVGMEEGLFPHSRSLMDREEMEEERRLCYVGITRTKQNLYFTFTRRRLYFGSFGANSVSRFLGDINENLLESVNDNQGH
jgi:DNA helicase-2/ATP-dependent DNA helicase PcrA